jgi:hypothetical protein
MRRQGLLFMMLLSTARFAPLERILQTVLFLPPFAMISLIVYLALLGDLTPTTRQTLSRTTLWTTAPFVRQESLLR